VSRDPEIDRRVRLASFAIEHRPYRPLVSRVGTCRTAYSPIRLNRTASSHLIRRRDPQQCEAGGENGDDTLDQGKTRHGQLWIILDNEA
jgi:hypothetical protein